MIWQFWMIQFHIFLFPVASWLDSSSASLADLICLRLLTNCFSKLLWPFSLPVAMYESSVSWYCQHFLKINLNVVIFSYDYLSIYLLWWSVCSIFFFCRIFFLLLNLKMSYVFWVSSLSDMCFVNIVPQLVGLSFHLLTVTFSEQIFILVKFNLSTFLHVLYFLVSYLRNICLIRGHKDFLLCLISHLGL